MELDKKIDQYSDELYVDLGLIDLPEDKKAEIYARLQDHLHRVILDTLSKVLHTKRIKEIEALMEQEDYGKLAKVLRKYPQHAEQLEQKVQDEFDKLRVTILEEQQHAKAEQ